MKILFINNDGGGWADHIEVADGTTVTELFADKLPTRKAGRFSHPRQPPSGRGRPGPPRWRPGLDDADQD